MTLARAILYFLREAGVNLLRSWKISLLAISTIAVSLFIGGSFLFVIRNAHSVVQDWKSEAKVLVYLRNGQVADPAGKLAALIRRAPWVTGVDAVTPEQARQRFAKSFPSVADLLQGWDQEPLPASFEVAFDPAKVDEKAFAEWVAVLRNRPEVGMVDDDRDWVAELETVLRVVTGVGVALGGVLLGAAIFTIASVIRLTAYLYREEIEIMRLVGATEFFIRGPFYLEGLLQGLVGGLAAVLSLYAAYFMFQPSNTHSLLAGFLSGSFLGPTDQVMLVLVGAVSGLSGAILSLRRESIA